MRLALRCIGLVCMCDALQHTATHCKTLQRTATHCNTRMIRMRLALRWIGLVCMCNTLQHRDQTHVCVRHDSFCKYTGKGRFAKAAYPVYAGAPPPIPHFQTWACSSEIKILLQREVRGRDSLLHTSGFLINPTIQTGVKTHSFREILSMWKRSLFWL